LVLDFHQNSFIFDGVADGDSFGSIVPMAVLNGVNQRLFHSQAHAEYVFW
jgi:hypothetical protein